MGDGLGLGAYGTRWEEAFKQVDKWLTAYFEGVTRLGPDALCKYPNRTPRAGWRVPVDCASGRRRRFDILIGAAFPFEPPRIALVDAPPYLTWPHLESDGYLCLLPAGATVMFEEPVGVVENLLKEAVEWLEASEAGQNIDDFRAEFASYWSADAAAPQVRSLLRADGPSRSILVHRLQGIYVVADEAETLTRWLDHAVPLKEGPSREIEPALLVWLDKPMLPSEYPSSAAALVGRVQAAGLVADLEKIAAKQSERIVAVVGALSQNGPVFAGIILRPNATRRGGPRRGRGFEDGFRPGRTPTALLANRVLSGMRSLKAKVERVDASWIHGRDADPDLPVLRSARVAIVGCGSLGGPVALSLAEAGVGKLDLIDPEELRAANVGRHPLGAPEIGLNKARALSDRIKAAYPHINHVEHYMERWEHLILRRPEVLEEADLIISTIGGWSSEGALNAWRHDRENKPDLLFGWTEPYGVAGHVVGSVGGRGCLACGLRSWGEPSLTVADWPSGAGLRGEPACGVMFQPYGAVEAAHIVALIAEAAVDVLLNRAGEPFHRIWVARERILTRAGGVWSKAWTAACGGRPSGGVSVDRCWPKRADCPICGPATR
jgi:sulfur-carrier protein adenylyltransferase/sulfurtransferase